MLAVIGGTSLIESSLFASLKEQTVTTTFGDAQLYVGDSCCYVQRHGQGAGTPPHRINHHANIAAIQELGIRDIIAINSTGSLRLDVPPGSLLVPHDYFNLFHIPTFFDDQMKFTVPGLDERLRTFILATARKHDIPVVERGVYFQVQGPVLETPTEIAFIKQIGDVVGMTMANEAILAREIDLAYASVCMVDNYANGIADQPLTLDQIDVRRAQNLGRLEHLLEVTINAYTDHGHDA